MDIAHLVSRRTDLSTFIVHLTRDTNGAGSARDNMHAILDSRQIQASGPLGQARDRVAGDADARRCQNVVCFTETPLEYVHLLIEEIDGRQFRYSAYGIALPKPIARARSINPVWYMDITPGHDWLTEPLNNLIDAAIRTGNFADTDIARIAPFVEQMGTRPGHYRKEFWWEREWRKVGNVDLPDRIIGLSPERDFDDLNRAADRRGVSVTWIDPKWGLEQIIGRLAGFDDNEIGVL